MVTTRMNNTEYAQTFVELENATEMNDTLLEKLTQVANECDARGVEISMGKRSSRGNAGSQGRRFVNLINNLNGRFYCRLSRKQAGDTFKVRPAGSWR